MKKTLSLLCLSLSFAVLGQTLQEKLDMHIAKQVGYDTPGLAIAVLRDGKSDLIRAYGMANLENQIPFTPETVTDIGSVAKQFTSMAIVLLAEEGKLEIDAPISRYLDGVPPVANAITLRHLLNHTSGLREVYGILSFQGNRSGDGIRQEDAQRQLSYATALNFPPGDRYMYCNTAYMLLADIVEEVSGMSYEDFLGERIFAPLQMEQTYVMDKSGEIFPKMGPSYRPGENGYLAVADNSTAYGQGGIYSSMTDLVRWVQHLDRLNSSNHETLQLMRTPGIVNNDDTLDYALGLTVDDYRGLERFGHTGASAGYRSNLQLFPGENLAVIIKTNFPGLDLSKIIDVVLEHEVSPDQLQAKTNEEEQVEEQKAAINLSHAELQKYQGKYYCPEFQLVIDIEVKDGKLIVENRKVGKSALNPMALDQFSGEMGEVQFLRKGRRVTGFKVSNGRTLNLEWKRLKSDLP